MRRLLLHASALNNDEYSFYTASLDELAIAPAVHDDSDAYYEALQVSVREARAWLRGRYVGVAGTDVDEILKLFCPELGITDVLSGGQLFAALRLVLHAESGEKLDPNLAFVQTHPQATTEPAPRKSSSDPSQKPPPPPQHASKAQPPPPPTHPHTPLRRANTTHRYPPTTPSTPSASSSSSSTNPFAFAPPMKRTVSPSPSTSTAGSPALSVNTAPASTNPFKASVNKPTPPLPPRKPNQLSSISNPSPSTKTISSKPSVTSPFAAFIKPFNPSSSSINSIKPSPPIASTTPVFVGHHTTPLMRQSLEASKAAMVVKRVEEEKEKERVIDVIKRSNSNANASSSSASASKSIIASQFKRGDEIVEVDMFPDEDEAVSTTSSSKTAARKPAPPIPPQLPRRRPPSTIRSQTTLAPSTLFKDTYSRSTGAPIQTPSPPLSSTSSPTYNTRSLDSDGGPRSPFWAEVGREGKAPPPTHPDRKAVLSGPTPYTPGGKETFDAVYGSGEDTKTRVGRSKSMHLPASPTMGSASPPKPPVTGQAVPPPVPSRQGRKRPESVQAHPSSPSPFDDPSSVKPGVKSGGATLSRHTSLSTPPKGSHRREFSSPSASHFSDTISHSTAAITVQSNIQRTLAKLDALQPKIVSSFDAVRYKTEAGLMPKRGWVPHHHGNHPVGAGQEKLMGDVEQDESSGDEEYEDGIEDGPGRVGLERDDMKWPVANEDGWKPL